MKKSEAFSFCSSMIEWQETKEGCGVTEIEARLQRAAEHVRSLGYFPAYVSLYGSQNYGLSLDCDGYVSDYDFKCVVLPSLREITEERDYASLTVDFEGGQIDIKDIRLFTKLIARMNPAYLEGLLTAYTLVLPDGEAVEAMRALMPALFAERGAAFTRACVGLFEEKAKRMCHPSPAQAENIARYGYDLKQAHHMYRLLVTLREFERTGGMQLAAPQEEQPLLMDLKRGRYDLEAVLRWTEAWRAEIHALAARLEAAYGKEAKTVAKQLEKLRRDAVYAHCRSEVLQDGRICD